MNNKKTYEVNVKFIVNAVGDNEDAVDVEAQVDRFLDSAVNYYTEDGIENWETGDVKEIV